MKTARVMMALDFSEPNFPAALCTLCQWAICAKEQQNFEVVFGVSTTAQKPGRMLELIIKYLKPFPVFYWDNDVDLRAGKLINDSAVGKICRPFYPDFNYGSLVNKLLLLAHIVDCEFLVRVDPGTYPFSQSEYFGPIINGQIFMIKGTDRVVSQGYDGRLALRHTFVKNKERQEKLVHKYTKIDPTNQVTGGALWTSNVPGIPAMAFEKFGTGPDDLTLVWGSDDAIYQIMDKCGGHLPNGAVPRFDPEGMRKNTVSYYRGVVGMVYLSKLMTSNDEPTAKKETEDFLMFLKNDHLDEKKYRPAIPGLKMEEDFTMPAVAPDTFLKKIQEGLHNHAILLSDRNWTRIAAALREELTVGDSTVDRSKPV